MASAISSLPVPVSPLIKTVALVRATIRTMPSTCRRAALLPIMQGRPLPQSSLLSRATFADVASPMSKDALWLTSGRLPAQIACAAIVLLLWLACYSYPLAHQGPAWFEQGSLTSQPGRFMPRGLLLPTRTRLLIHDRTSEQTTHSRDSRECNASLGILLLLPGASGGATEQVAAWRLNLFKIKIVVDGFLAPYTKRGPRHRGKPLWVDLLIAL